MNNTFINFVSAKLLHTNKANNGREFVNVSIPVEASKTGYGSFAVNPGQVMNSTKKDGSLVDGYKNILLGAADKQRQVSICTKTATKKSPAQYSTIAMTNGEIAEAVAASRKAYRANTADDAE